MTEQVSDDDLVAAIEQAVADGDRDLCAGGVAPVEIAERVELSVSRARERCKRLVEAGRLQEASGVAPETYTPRVSYLPAAE